MRDRCWSCKKWEEHFYWDHFEESNFHFMKVMDGDFTQKMEFPQKFAKNFRVELIDVVALEAPSGKLWEIGLSKGQDDHFYFNGGWKNFIEANEIQEDYILIFKYAGDSTFQVRIFDKTGCVRVASDLINDAQAKQKKVDQTRQYFQNSHSSRIACNDPPLLHEQATDNISASSRGLMENEEHGIGEVKDGLMDTHQSGVTSSSKRKKRRNFIWSLKPEWVTGLLQIMSEYVDANIRSAQRVKDAVYDGVAHKLKDKFGIEVTVEQCKNQIRHQRTIWSHIQELKNKSGVSWDDNKKIIIMGQEEYGSHIQAFPKDAIFLNIPITNYVELEKVCGEGHAIGAWAKTGCSQSLFGIPEINLDDNDTTDFMEFDIDTSPLMQPPVM